MTRPSSTAAAIRSSHRLRRYRVHATLHRGESRTSIAEWVSARDATAARAQVIESIRAGIPADELVEVTLVINGVEDA